jgi:carbamoyltransferase
MNILGISCYFHDSAAALVNEQGLVAASSEERFTRIKHDRDFPSRAIEFCLTQASISCSDLDYIVFYEKPFRRLERMLISSLQTFPRSLVSFREASISWLNEKLWVKQYISEKVCIAPSRILFCEHHLSHATSAFLCSPFDESAILTIDGVGEWATATIGIGRGTSVQLLHEMRFPHSIGLLYSAFTAFLGFEVNEGEYKVMGMAAFGTPRYTDKVWKLIRRTTAGFVLDMSYFSYHYSACQSYRRKFVKLFGPPRAPGLHFFIPGGDFPSYFGEKPSDYSNQAAQNQYYADIAASVQKVTEELVLDMALEASLRTGLDRLCFAGGVALNSVANSRIAHETPFQEIYIQPAAGDAGGALGAALWAKHTILGCPRDFVLEHAYWGEETSEFDTETWLRREQIPYERLSDDEMLSVTANALAAGKVVGWVQGRSEWGPRALGNRSILADPRRAEMKDVVNTKIKFREPFRPFAPSVLAEYAHEFFELPDTTSHMPSRFMLYVNNVRPEKREIIPAVTHIDGTSRLQVVHKEANPRYHQLISRFADQTGVPVLLNTSFNLKGEPIVNSPGDAYATFMSSGMDILVLGKLIVRKERAMEANREVNNSGNLH